MRGPEHPRWEPWQHEYVHGALYLFPSGDVAAIVNEMRQRYDPKSAAICDAHITLSEPLSAPLTKGQLEELQISLKSIPPLELVFGPLTQMGDHPGVVYDISPIAPYLELRRAIHATSAFSGREVSREDTLPHMTVAEFITINRTFEILNEFRDAPTGHFCFDEVTLATPDRLFHFSPELTIPLGGH